jgi:hypothetical protein
VWQIVCKRVARAVALMIAVPLVMAGCSFRDRICAEGMYPVVQVGSNTGRTCVRDGQEPPAGYVRFPDGKVPEHVDDEWDQYWRDHVIDQNGVITPA